MIILLSILSYIPQNISAAQPVASITIDNPDQEVNVAPSDSGIVNFTGTVEVDMVGPGQNIQSVVVNLRVSCEDWEATISPATLYFTSQQMAQAKAFSVAVGVPFGCDAGTVQQVIVSGTMTTDPGGQTSDIQPAEGIIEVSLYSVVEFVCDMPEKTAEPGKMVEYDFLIRNNGNGRVGFSFGFEQDEIFLEQCGDVSFSKGNLYLEKEQETHIRLIIDIHDDAQPRTYHLTVWTTPYDRGVACGESGVSTITLHVKEVDFFDKIPSYWFVLGGLILIFITAGIVLFFRRRTRLKKMR